MNFDMSGLSELPPFEECSVILSVQEYERFEHMTRQRTLLCIHKWVHRKGRPDADYFVIVGDNEITRRGLPDGHYCPKCQNVRFTSLKGDAPVWTQKDMMALGFK